MGKSRRMPGDIRNEMFEQIERGLESVMKGREFPPEIARTFNRELYSAFEQDREVPGGGNYNLKPVFVGQYFVDPTDPRLIRVLSGAGTDACSPIPIKRGIIGRAMRTGRDQYIPNVLDDPDHVSCDDEMAGTEVVLLSWSDPFQTGPYKGKRMPLGVLDIDLNVEDALSPDDIARLKRIWRPYRSQIFPGDPDTFASIISHGETQRFELTPKIAALYEFLPSVSKNAKKKSDQRKTWPNGTEVRETG